MGEFDRVFARHRRDAVLLHRPYPPHAAPRTNSHLGGLPRLPAHHDWPRTSAGVPLHFLAQIDCAELPFASALPDRGVLFFFGRDDAEQVWNDRGTPADDCRVLYLLDAFAATPPREPPADLPPIGDEYFRHGSRDFYRRGETGPNVHTGWPVVLRRIDSWPDSDPTLEQPADWRTSLLNLLRSPPSATSWEEEKRRAAAYGDALARHRAETFTAATGERLLTKRYQEEPNQDGNAAARVFFHAEDGPDAWPQHWIGIHYAARRLLHEPRHLTPSRHPRFMGPLVANAEAWLARADAAGLATPVPPADKAEFRGCLRKLRKPRYEQELGSDAQRIIFSALVATVQAWAGDRDLAALIPLQVAQEVRFRLNGYWNDRPAYAQMLGHASSAQEALPPNDPTICLLNLASDVGMGWMFGDVGFASFWITPEALARRDFASVWATIEGH